MIIVDNICKSFDGNNVLKNFSINIETGKTVVILGRSGEGKSVLLKNIIGIQKPDSGFIDIDGVKISELSGGKLFKSLKKIGLGMLFQGSALFDSMTVFENTAFYLNQHEDLSYSEIKDKVADALAIVDMPDTQHLMPADLSGGMRKRAALARLIVYRPHTILYDEPTTGLDPITAMHINELILKTQTELKTTSVVVTHDIASALKVSDRIALQHDGKIAFYETKEDFVRIEDPLVRGFLKNALPNEIKHLLSNSK